MNIPPFGDARVFTSQRKLADSNYPHDPVYRLAVATEVALLAIEPHTPEGLEAVRRGRLLVRIMRVSEYAGPAYELRQLANELRGHAVSALEAAE